MTASTSPTPGAGSKPPFYRDVRVLRIGGQALALILVVAFIMWLRGNLLSNLRALNIEPDFGQFLQSPTSFKIRDSGFDQRSPVWKMFLVGIQNTLAASVVGIMLAMVVGLAVGIGRLSTNWLVNRLAMLYVETLRNIPPLVILIFFGFAIFTYGPLPIFREATEIKLPGTDNNLLMLSNERIGIPSFFANDTMGWYWIVLALAVIAVVGVRRWRKALNEQTGTPDRKFLWSAGTFLGFALIGYVVLGRPFSMSWPEFSENQRLVVNGFSTNSGFWSVAIALGLYTASHIAEIIRGSIQAVAKGQSEAANALALSGFQRYRFIILPQAFRIAIPATINQFLNLVKNTSLATAVAYPELTALVKTLIGNGKPALESIAVMMAIYLTFSLTISFVLNIVNNKMQIVGR